MSIIVQKYGGTSVANIERIENIAAKLIQARNSGHDVVVAVSAMSGETNRLVELAKKIKPLPDPREYDVLLSTGEQVTIALLCMALKKQGQAAKSYTGWQIKIKTDSAFNKARIKGVERKRILADLKAGNIVVVAGFQGVDKHGNITTLGRGGSDTTAVALAAALQAKECQIYTDVDGVYTTDPRVVANARRLDKVTFEEMLEMSSLGSKILQIRAVELAGKHNVPMRVLSSLTAGNGTLITLDEKKTVEKALISGIAFNKDEAQITISGVPDCPGIAASILSPVADKNIEIDMIVQNVGGNGLTDFTFTVHRNDYEKCFAILEPKVAEIGAKSIVGDEQIVKVSVVGVGMRSHAGIASKVFKILAKENVNIRMISTSEIKISVVIDQKYLELAVRALHSGLGLDKD